MLRARYSLPGYASSNGATKMKVFCPEHKRGFFAPRQSPIKCENRGHILGELDFEGAAQPSCPGCLQATSADLREHTCDGLGASFITALSSCPICQERLDIGPSFPSSVARYLKRTKAANKVNVTFDYETELFVPVEDGE